MAISDDWDRLLSQLERERAERREGASPTPVADAAWEELGRRIRRLGRLFVARQELDDLVQNVLMKLQSPDVLRRLRAARAPEGYLAVMIRNAAIDLIRRRAAMEAEGERPEGGLDEPNAILGALDREKRAAALRQIIVRLSDDEQLLLRLRFWDEMSILEISRQFGMPYSTVAVRLFRMLRRLRSHLESVHDEP